MMHQQIGKKKKYFIYFLFFLFLSTINNPNLIKNMELLFTIKDIEVSGLTKNLNLDIKKKFENLLNKNIYFVKKDYFNNQLDFFNYLENYKVFKLYPSKIAINLTQTNLLATTIKNNKKYFIGSNGKFINHDIMNFNKDLPNVFGNFSSEDFILFKKIITESNFDYQNIKDIFFFPSGRWDIKTKNKITIKLPKEDINSAFIIARKLIKNNQLNNNNVIDLRITNQVILLNE